MTESNTPSVSLRELNEPKREELLSLLWRVELQATRHRRANDSLEYLLRDIEFIARIVAGPTDRSPVEGLAEDGAPL